MNLKNVTMNLRKLFFSPLCLLVLLMALITLSSCEKEKVEETVEENLPNISGFPIVGTNQSTFFNNSEKTTTQEPGDGFYGQNANYPGTTPSYSDNDDGTVTDNVTGLMWQQTFDHNGDGSIDYDDKLSYNDILTMADTVTTGGYTDWRLPSLKEMYSLIMFSGQDVSSYSDKETENLIPFINTDYFDFAYGDTKARERLIDVQCATTNLYVSTEVSYVFGVNLADGRIKGYGYDMGTSTKMFNYLLVRGNETYGINSFTDNGDGTITDEATGLMWMQDDNAEAIFWEGALSYAENFEYAGHTDWRLPDVKELQSIVDYTRSPASSNSAAIDPIFNCTVITNEAGEDDYPWYWSSTTHMAYTGADPNGRWAAYLAFGRCMGTMGTDTWSDVHGAGAQRSDPKEGDPTAFIDGHGPQGDAVRVINYVRLVRYAD